MLRVGHYRRIVLTVICDFIESSGIQSTSCGRGDPAIMVESIFSPSRTHGPGLLYRR